MSSTTSSDMMTWLPSFATFNGMDWFIVVVVTTSVLISLWRGFTREAMSLAGWVIAFVLANLFASPLSTYLAGIIDNVTGRYIVAWSVLFLVILLRELVPPKDQQWLYQSQLMPHVDVLMKWSEQMFDKVRSGEFPTFTA